MWPIILKSRDWQTKLPLLTFEMYFNNKQTSNNYLLPVKEFLPELVTLNKIAEKVKNPTFK